LDHIKTLLRQAQGAGFADNTSANDGNIALTCFASDWYRRFS
jgi:hypothetical protein